MGMLFFKRLPGRVVDLPLICCFFLIGAKSRSMVAGLMVKSFSFTWLVKVISPYFSSTAMNSPKKGASLLEQMESASSQIWFKAMRTSWS
jgi:hypothetical protein